MLASEHCSDPLYDSQYHSVKMEPEYNFKQESDLLENSKASISTNVNIAMMSSSSTSPSSDMITYQPNQNYQQHQQQLTQQFPQQSSWYQQPVTSNANPTYSTDDLFYASLPPPPPVPPLFSFPSPLPKKKQLINRNHPRHKSANGILQQYAHYHYQNPSQQQQQQQFAQSLQRQTSSSTTNSTQSPPPPPPSTFTMTPSFTSSCTTPNMQYASTTSTSSSPTDSLFSTDSTSCTLKKYHHDDSLKKPTSLLRYQISLQTSTTAAQRIGEPSPMTYLNRGQAYGIHFQDQQQQQTSKDTLITSTISITFHDITHRQASHNYWRFWLGQQDRPNEARALDLDAQQSAGLISVHYPSFDRITIQWQPQVGATLFVRFNCLSTDFSRIKGVKGIPLRVLVESTANTPLSSSPLSFNGDGLVQSMLEKSFCKIKLFRDKGAERKNKDDAKQISKQLEKLKAEGNPQHNPLWHFYNQPVLPYSTFEALPEEEDVIKEDYSMTTTTATTTTTTTAKLSTTPLSAPNIVSSITTTPTHYTLSTQPLPTPSPLLSSPLSSIGAIHSPMQPIVNNGLSLQTYQQQQHDSNMTIASSFYPPTFSYPQPHFVQPASSFMFNPTTSSSLGCSQQPSWSSSHISPVIGRKRSRSHMVVSTHPSPPEDQPPMKRSHYVPALTLFVSTKKNSMELRRIELETLSVQHLVIKLSALFSLQAQSVIEVLWRRDPTATTTTTTTTNNTNTNNINNNNNNNLELNHRQQQKKQTTPPPCSSSGGSSSSSVLVLVEDCVLEHFQDQSIIRVQWEISSAGMVRFILESYPPPSLSL